MRKRHFIFFTIMTLMTGFVLFMLWFAGRKAPSPEVRVVFLDVGQGDAMLIQTPAKQDILIDGGPDSGILTQLGQYLSWHNRDLELMILTHPHADHLTGLLSVLERYDVRMILEPRHESHSQLLEEWTTRVQKEGAEVQVVQERKVFDLGEGVVLQILDAFGVDESGSSVNDTSLVARLSYGAVDFLFTGDITQQAEKVLIERYVKSENSSLRDRRVPSYLEAEILKVPHHGSKHSSSAEFLAAVKPQIAVISVGAKNRYFHPHSSTLLRLQRAGTQHIARTDEHGTTVVTADHVGMISFWGDRNLRGILSP